METHSQHAPVMFKEVLEFLDPQMGATFVDGTLGLGGHARGVLEKIGPQGRFIGIDRDARSLLIAKQSLETFSEQCIFVHNDFRNIDQVLSDLKISEVDGILLDLGISSFQLDNPDRGFSIKADGPLDMRMDQDSFISAYDLVNSLSEKEISAILKNFGEERWHNRIARYLVAERQKHSIETTQELSAIVLRAIPHHQKWGRIHPATRTFQAFRIAVNRELEALEMALDKCVNVLKSGGRFAVIAFHSLEDRIVKQKFRALSDAKVLKLITKKPLQSDDEEVKLNSRSRSARLRIIERI